MPGETHRKKSVGNLLPLYTNFTFGHIQMVVFSSISKVKALILDFSVPWTLRSLCAKAAGGKQMSPPSALQHLGGSAPKQRGFARGIIFRGRECSSGACAGALLALWALFHSQPPEEGRLGSANASPRGDTAGAPRAFTALVWRSEPCRCGCWSRGVTQGAAQTLPEVHRRFQMMELGPVVIPGSGVLCAPTWRLCLTESWAAERSPSCARGVVGSHLNHRASSSLGLKALRKSLASLKSDLGVVIWRWVVWSGRGGYRGTVLPPWRRWPC